MREIKFRAWNLKTNKMIIKNHPDYLMTFEGDFYSVDNINGVTYHNTKSDHILMQYTGLKDKNGKEIYEGDIISDEYELLEVVFKNGFFGYRNVETPIIFRDPQYSLEVVGNIFENPELLK